MPGLSLNVRGGIGGGFTPLTPASASASTSYAGAIADKAYGISGSGQAVGPKTAGLGSTGIGLLSVAALVFIWYSLPR
jgi:hypothetical protein